MCNRYMSSTTCRHLTMKFLIQGHPRTAKVPHIADFKSAYISLIIGTRGFQCVTNLQEIMGWESSGVVRSFKVKQGYPNFKVLITRLLLVLEVYNVKPTYRKSWSGNLLMWQDLTLGPFFKVKQG